MSGDAIGLLVLIVLFAAYVVAEYRDRQPYRGPSMTRIGLIWNPAGPSPAVGEYALGRIGSLRVQGWTAATAKAGNASWRFEASGLSVVVTPTDADGRPIGEYDNRRHILRWGGRELDYLSGSGRRPSAYRKRAVLSRDGRYAVADNGQIIAFLRADGRDWRINPINIELDDAVEAEPGLLLLAAFVGARLAQRDRDNDGGV